MSEKYMSDFDCLRSFSAVRQSLYYDKKLMTKPPVFAQQSNIQQLKEKKCTAVVNDFSSDDSIIMAIQNDTKFINIIMNCRKQKAPLAYMFVESEYRYITCIIKNPDGFPLIIIRIPINKKFTYAKNTNNCYEFPISDIINKDIKYNKSYSYTMIFKYNGQNVQFIYDIYNGTAEPNRITIDSINVGNNTIIDNMFKTDNMSLIQTQLFNPSLIIPENKADLLSFNNMNITILMEANPSNIISFNSKQHYKTKNYFRLTPTQLFYVSEANKKHSDVYICSNYDSLYWNNIDTDTKIFEMLPFESLFKINYNKSITPNDKIYYLFTTFLDNYMFIKVITLLEINATQPIETFIKTFSHDYQILECYMCSKSDVNVNG